MSATNGTISPTLTDLISFASNKCLFLHEESNDCCIVSDTNDIPSGMGDYQLELILSDKDENVLADNQSLYLAASSASTAEPTFNTILHLLSSLIALKDPTSVPINLTLKAFCTTPRQVLPSLQDATSLASFARVGFQFVAMDAPTARLVVQHVRHLALLQSTITSGEGLGDILKHANSVVETLIFSGNQADFATLGSGLVDNASLKHLQLTCHFYVSMKHGWESLCHGLSNNASLESLAISYLELPDIEWVSLLQALHNHPKLTSLKLMFTDNFVDSYRRLTEKRIIARSEAMRDLLQASPNIRVLEWPACQQDPEISQEIFEAILRQR
jgi:hypothetical protein